MLPSRHFVVSVVAGAGVSYFTKSLYAGLVCLAVGMLVDSDHAIEQAVHFGLRNTTYKKCLEANEQTMKLEGEFQYKKLYLIFHSIELMVLLWVLFLYTGNIYVLAVTSGYSVHMVCDLIGNRDIHSSYYFMIWRAIKQFRSREFVKQS